MQSRLANGYVVFKHYSNHEILRKGHLWLHELSKEARPWKEELNKDVLELGDEKVLDILHSFSLKNEELHFLLDSLEESSKKKVMSLLDIEPIRSISSRHVTITEREGCWIVDQTGELVTDAILRIEEIISSEDKDPVAKGYILYKESNYEFEVSNWLLRTKTIAIIDDLLIRRGVGPAKFIPFYTRKCSIYDLSIHFHVPRVINKESHDAIQKKEF